MAQKSDKLDETFEHDRSLYQDQRKLLLGTEADIAKDFDKWLLTLCGGAMGLSMTFMKDIVHGTPTWKAILGFAWLAFGIAIVAILTNIKISHSATELYLDILDQEFGKPYEIGIMNRVRDAQHARGNRRVRFIAFLNWFSLVCFGIGVAMLATFIVINL